MTKFKKIIGIMAATEEGVIGQNSSLPWYYPEELEHFRLITRGHTIVMGRKTYDTMPRSSLSDRRSIVFSRSPKTNNGSTIFVKSLNEYFSVIASLKESEKIFMIGGAEIAHLFLNHKLISSFILTRIHHLYSGDAYLDLKYLKGWNENVLKSNPSYTIFQLTNP